MTIFYSWQSDTDTALNRNFIEDCLGRALRKIGPELSLELAPRIDRDTQGVPGTPEITATIMRKIDECDVFVADVTLVATTDAGKRSPNPNVMLEWGYALKARGSSAVVHVMNTAFGAPNELPFNLVHRRWPIDYALANREERGKVRQILVASLGEALRASLRFAAETARSASGAPASSLRGIRERIMGSDPQRDWARSSDGSREWAVFVHDVNLRLELDYENRVQNQNYREDWANRFPDKSASGYWCDVVYGSSRALSLYLVSVDGGRAMLPPPTVRNDPPDLRVDPLWFRIAEVFDTLGTLYDYFRRAGLSFGPSDANLA